MAPLMSLRKYENDIDDITHLWKSYPVKEFVTYARPKETFRGYIDDVFQKPRKLARSASCAHLQGIREADCSETVSTLKKCPSYSVLSPSHMLRYVDRVADRYIASERCYEPESINWYRNSYSPFKFRDTLRYEYKITKPIVYPTKYYQENVGPYSYLRTKAYKLPSWQSFIGGTIDYRRRYASNQIKGMDFAASLAYRNYDQDINHRFLRFCSGGSSSFVNSPFGVPENAASRYPHRLYQLRHRVLYDY